MEDIEEGGKKKRKKEKSEEIEEIRRGKREKGKKEKGKKRKEEKATKNIGSYCGQKKEMGSKCRKDFGKFFKLGLGMFSISMEQYTV